MKSYTSKAFILIGIIVLLSIPMALLFDTLDERERNAQKVTLDIAHSYGAEQKISTPMLVIPYSCAYQCTQDGFIVLPPKVAESQVVINDKIKKRGIYKVPVYDADIEFQLMYDLSEVEALKKSDETITIEYHRAFLRFRADESSSLRIKQVSDKLQTFTKNQGFIEVSNPLPKNHIKYDTSFVISFKGSTALKIIPIGNNEKISITSKWKSPSFSGILPDDISEKNGFSARWDIVSNNNEEIFFVPSLRDVRLGIDGDSGNYGAKYIGVELKDFITEYRLIERTIKYGIVFIILTLALIFLCDFGLKTHLHILQYGVIAMCLAAFYLLLLSLSEQIGFILAYIIAALAVVVPIAIYGFAILRNKRFALISGCVLGGLYLVLLGILKIENYSLLLGSILLMIVLYIMMFLTRNLRTQ